MSTLYTYQENKSLFSLEQVSAHPQYDVHVNNTKMECILLKRGKPFLKPKMLLFPSRTVET